MKATSKSTLRTTNQLHAALERIVNQQAPKEVRREQFGRLLGALASRMPAPEAHTNEEAPNLSEQDVPAEQCDRARGYLADVGGILHALRELSVKAWGDDRNAFQTAVEHMSIRAGTLVNAALFALNGFAPVDRDHEDIVERSLYERRRIGRPEDEAATA